jgi:molybdopterin-guanine dinucleotide biosynthesis protein A
MYHMLTISIQAGGGSTRMGQDKALIPFLGQPLIQRVVERLAPVGDEVVITTNQPENYRFLNLPVFPDVIPGVGALGGLYTALKVASHTLVAVVACDLPFANPDLLAACRDILLEKDCDAVIPSTERGLEPLHAVYRVAGCLPLVEAALEAGKRRMIAWHGSAEVVVLSPEETARYDPQGVTFWNVNTPKEFERAEKKALVLAQGGKNNPTSR